MIMPESSHRIDKRRGPGVITGDHGLGAGGQSHPCISLLRELRCVVTQWPVQPRECTNLVSRQIALLAAIEH